LKIFICSLLAIGLGIGLGFLQTVAEFGWKVTPPALAGTQQIKAQETGPRLVIAQDTFAFGRMYQNQTGTHTFVLRNEGLADLTIHPGKPSCKCTVSKVSRKTIPPGETAQVTLTWKTGKSNGKYRKRAPVSTNDPAQPKVQLKIEGTVTAEFAFRPRTLFASSLATDTGTELEAQLFFYGKQPVQLLGQELSDPKIAEHFSIGYHPIATEDLNEPYAKCGYTITVKILPGMAAGNFHQAVVFRTEPEMVQPARLNINGTVRMPVNIFGRQFDKTTQTLNMGTVTGDGGQSMRLLMQVAGQHRDKVKVQLLRSDPPGITLQIGPNLSLAKGTLRQFPLIFTLPKSMKPSHYGVDTEPPGKIVLATGHPDYPEITLHVKLTVEPKDPKKTKEIVNPKEKAAVRATAPVQGARAKE